MFEGTEAMLSHADGVLVYGRDIDIEPHNQSCATAGCCHHATEILDEREK